jgi:hypothetical protein
LFGGGDEAASAQAPVLVPATNVPTVAPTPIVVERIVYQDEYVTSGPSAPSSSGGGVPASSDDSAPRQSQQPAPPASSEEPQDVGAPEEHEGYVAIGSEFSGTVLAVSGSSFTMAVGSDQVTVHVGEGTEVHDGALVPGVIAKVHTIKQGDGTLLATEVEIVGGEHDD